MCRHKDCLEINTRNTERNCFKKTRVSEYRCFYRRGSLSWIMLSTQRKVQDGMHLKRLIPGRAKFEGNYIRHYPKFGQDFLRLLTDVDGNELWRGVVCRKHEESFAAGDAECFVLVRPAKRRGMMVFAIHALLKVLERKGHIKEFFPLFDLLELAVANANFRLGREMYAIAHKIAGENEGEVRELALIASELARFVNHSRKEARGDKLKPLGDFLVSIRHFGDESIRIWMDTAADGMLTQPNNGKTMALLSRLRSLLPRSNWSRSTIRDAVFQARSQAGLGTSLQPSGRMLFDPAEWRTRGPFDAPRQSGRSRRQLVEESDSIESREPERSAPEASPASGREGEDSELLSETASQELHEVGTQDVAES